MKPSTLFWCATAMAACANVSSPSTGDTQRLTEARRLLRENPEAALRITDALLKEKPNLLPARLVAAEGARLLALSGTGSQPEMLLRDAVRDIERAEALDASALPPETYQLLAECRFDLGEFEAADAAATKAFEGMRGKNRVDARRKCAEAALLAGNARLRTFVPARQAEIDGGEKDDHGNVKVGRTTADLAQRAAEAFAAAASEFPGEAVAQTATLHQWLGQPQAAIEELERGIRNHPGEAAIHEAYRALMVERGMQDVMAGAYARFVKENPGAIGLTWYLGRAQFLRADRLRGQGNYAGAAAGYGRAVAAFGEYRAMAPNDVANTDPWLALAELSIARTAVDEGDLTAAQQHLFAAADCSPDVYATDDGQPRLADSFGSHYSGVVFAIHAALAESGPDALAKTLAFNEAVLQRHPDTWGFVYNNAALAARDLGVRKEAGGEHVAAMELWERSYRYYEKAVQLSPDDARVHNDCGLMLLYHLKRDFDRAAACFDRAIAIGQAQLAALPQDADATERERIEEAVGDAWQNKAVLAKTHLGKPLAEYRELCERAVKYYPYERREAAAMLREGAGEAAAAAQGGAAEAFAKVKDAAQKKAAEGDLDGALAELDKVAKECKQYAPYLALKGEFNLTLARNALASGRRGAEFLLQDAIGLLKSAVDLDAEPNHPRLLLAEAQYEASAFGEAVKAASELLLHVQSQGNKDTETLAAAHALRAKAGATAYAAAKNDGKDDSELLTAVRTSFRYLEKAAALDATQLDTWATTEQWAGAGAEAVNVYARALAKNPDDQGLLGKVVDTAFAQQQMALAVETLQPRSDATGLWFLGKALYLRSGAEREAQKNDDALKTLDLARKAFADSRTKNAGYADSCRRWEAMCLGKKGNIAFWTDDLKNAEKWLIEAAKLAPEGITDDLGLAETTKLGIQRVADKYYKKNDLGKVEAIYRAATDAANGDLDLMNNEGLFARDYGNQLEQQGKKKEAMELYEQSYKAYTRAQQLDPANVQLRNDTALIAIYHLDRDWDLAKQLLDSAIADGEKTLKDNPPADRDELQMLHSAVGDCYENLALWHLKHSKDAAAAKAAATKSMEHYPGQRRGGAQRHLQEAERLLQSK